MFNNKVAPNEDKVYKIRVSWFDKVSSSYYCGDWKNKIYEKFLTKWVNNQNKIYPDQFYRIEYNRIK
tara:strand:- start:4313 stop:4513 length:201 start_codon:yes stop_codon:yes gene_type:complete